MYHQKPLLGRQLNQAHPLANGLVGCWIMNEGSGDIIHDLSGNNNNLKFNVPANMAWKTNEGGACVYQDGTNNSSLVAVNASGYGPYSNSTVILTGRLYSLASIRALWSSNGAADVDSYCNTSGNAYHWASNTDESRTSVTASLGSIIAGKLFSVAFVFGNGFKNIYVNGVLEASEAKTAKSMIFKEIGIVQGDLEGEEDHVNAFLYNRALTSQEVKELYINSYIMFEEAPLLEIYEESEEETATGITEIPRIQHQKPVLGEQIDFSHPLSKGLVGCWIMNEGSGNEYANLALPSKDLIARADGGYTAPLWVPGGIDYNVYTKCVYIADNLGIDGKITAVIFANASAIGSGDSLFSACDGGSSPPAIFRQSTGGTLMFYNPNGSIETTWALTTNVDYMFAITNDGSEGKIYVDGQEKANGGGAGIQSVTAGLQLGSWSSGAIDTNSVDAVWDGKIYAAFVWNRALTSQEMLQFYIDPYAIFKLDPKFFIEDIPFETDIQTVFLPDGSILVTKEGTGDVGVAIADYWEWDDDWAEGINRAAEGILSFSASLTRIATFNRKLVGDLDITGIIKKRSTLYRFLTGEVTFSGIIDGLLKGISVGMTGSLIRKYIAPRFEQGDFGSDGALSRKFTGGRNLTGIGNYIGTLIRGYTGARNVSGDLDSTGDLKRKGTLSRFIEGDFSWSGVVDWSIALVQRAVEGILAFGATLTRIVTFKRQQAGDFDAVGTINRTGTLGRVVLGVLTSTGIIKRQGTLYRHLSGEVTFSGVVDWSIALIKEAVAGILAFGATLTRIVTFKRQQAGDIDAAGAVNRVGTLGRIVLGALTSTGIVNRQGTLYRSLTGEVTFSGVIDWSVDLIKRTVEGILTFGASLTRIVTFKRQPVGDIDAAGTVSRMGTLGRAVLGVLTFTGIVNRQGTLYRSLVGEVTFSGTVNWSIALIKEAVEGILAFGASLTRIVTFKRQETGDFDTTGTVSRKGILGRIVLGVLTKTGVVDWSIDLIQRAIDGVIAFSASLTRIVTFKRKPEGSQNQTGTLSRKFTGARNIIGNLSFSGALTRMFTTAKNIIGNIGFQGTSIRKTTFYRILTAQITWGGIVDYISNALSVVLSAIPFIKLFKITSLSKTIQTISFTNEEQTISFVNEEQDENFPRGEA